MAQRRRDSGAVFHDVSGDSRARGFGHHRYGRGRRIHGRSARLHYWLDSPTNSRPALLGATTALGLLCKFSVPVFLLASGAGVWLAGATRARRAFRRAFFPMGPGLSRNPRGRDPGALGRIPVHLWLPLRVRRMALSKIDRLTGSRGPAHNAAYAVVEWKWIPAMPLLKGVAQMGQKEKRGEKSFLLGQIRSSGWWYFFLVALAVKTPLPLLILAGVGWLSVLWTSWVKRDWISAAPAIA